MTTARTPATSRRQAFALAAALTATVFTAFAALAGFAHRPAAAPAPAPAPVVQVAPAPPASTWVDD
jgi:hypothetical protein